MSQKPDDSYINAAVSYAQKKYGFSDEKAKQLSVRLHGMNNDIIDIVVHGTTIPVNAAAIMLDQFKRRVDIETSKKMPYDEDFVSRMCLSGFMVGLLMEKNSPYHIDDFISIDGTKQADIPMIYKTHLRLMDTQRTSSSTAELMAAKLGGTGMPPKEPSVTQATTPLFSPDKPTLKPEDRVEQSIKPRLNK